MSTTPLPPAASPPRCRKGLDHEATKAHEEREARRGSCGDKIEHTWWSLSSRSSRFVRFASLRAFVIQRLLPTASLPARGMVRSSLPRLRTSDRSGRMQNHLDRSCPDCYTLAQRSNISKGEMPC